ncbi:MAG TPA: Rieske (2Fe-2S) protein, partial [Polyangiales bacterium]|nr:Rieske (2Fe-2S) protein [Polyangiales bacterium]
RDHVTVVLLPRSPEGRPREALVVRDANGRVRAYRNLCRHLPVPLHVLGPLHASSGSSTRDVAARFPHDGHLQCMTHGASYRLQDGLCTLGPCRGSSLHSLEVDEQDGEVWILDDAEC